MPWCLEVIIGQLRNEKNKNSNKLYLFEAIISIYISIIMMLLLLLPVILPYVLLYKEVLSEVDFCKEQEPEVNERKRGNCTKYCVISL